MTQKPKRGERLNRLPTNIGGHVLAMHPVVARQLGLFEDPKPTKPIPLATLARVLGAESAPEREMPEPPFSISTTLEKLVTGKIATSVLESGTLEAAAHVVGITSKFEGNAFIITGVKPPEKKEPRQILL